MVPYYKGCQTAWDKRAAGRLRRAGEQRDRLPVLDVRDDDDPSKIIVTLDLGDDVAPATIRLGRQWPLGIAYRPLDS
jgi:hypothetical protein